MVLALDTYMLTFLFYEHIGVGGVFFEVAEPRSAEHGSYTPVSTYGQSIGESAGDGQ